jgi:DNA-binding response OmpR family regulator
MKLLLVEDDLKTSRAVRNSLAAEGYTVETARTGDEGLLALDRSAFDLIVLDWMLPGRDGISVLRTLRVRGTKLPVLLLTARDALEDRVLGLESGADDYLVKPFALAELVARIRALLRRAGDTESTRKRIADLVIDLETRQALRGADLLPLTPKEFDLLVYLLRHQGLTVTRAMLARDVWREPNRVTPLDNVIDVHIAHLRRKVDDGRRTRLIHTVRGVGFELKEKRAE